LAREGAEIIKICFHVFCEKKLKIFYGKHKKVKIAISAQLECRKPMLLLMVSTTLFQVPPAVFKCHPKDALLAKMHEIYINLVEFPYYHEKTGPGAPMAQTLIKRNIFPCFWESFYPQNALLG